MKLHTIVVLSDGESWGGLDSSSVLAITEEQHRGLCDGSLRVGDIAPVLELGLYDHPVSEQARAEEAYFSVQDQAIIDHCEDPPNDEGVTA